MKPVITRLMKKLGILVVIGGLLVLSGEACAVALANDPPPDLETIRLAAADYFPDEYHQYHMDVDQLYDLLHDGDPENDPLVVSVQTRAEYERGHIPGAINLPWDEITDVAQLRAQIPEDQLVVLYCNHCVHSAQISAILNLLGYDTLDLAYGFESWTKNQVAIPDHFDPACVCEHAMDTQTHTADPTGRYPQLNVAGSTPEEIITAAADVYLASEHYTNAGICPCDLEDLLMDGDAANDPFVLSLQWPDDYAKGHIPGAVNSPRWQVFEPENLSRLPTDQPIVICCYLGFTSPQVATILNMMGYDAQVSLHGMSTWTLDPQIVPFRIDDSRNWRDYPIEGTAAGVLAETMEQPKALPGAPVETAPWPEEYAVPAAAWLSQLTDQCDGLDVNWFLSELVKFLQSVQQVMANSPE
ncbi:MAG: rhodanese-like domain-containing protein [Chloroflexota bacterium]|nr:rhodanese-like domain-containing protein [Chloroflexota bacterium]